MIGEKRKREREGGRKIRGTRNEIKNERKRCVERNKERERG